MRGGQATPEMARTYFELFVNRTAYTLQSSRPNSSGKYYYYRPKGEKRLTHDIILKHLNGEITVALYAINPKTQRSKWVAIDADYEKALEDLVKMQITIRQDGIESALERSRRGAHLWFFPATPVLAKDCRLYVYNLARRIEVPIKVAGNTDGIEVFPRQDKLNANEFGNAIRGPLGIHRGAGRRFWFFGAHQNPGAQLDYLLRLPKFHEEQIIRLVDGLTMPADLVPRPTVVLPPYDPTRSEFRILDYVPIGRRVGKDYRTRCPSCGNRDKNGRHLAVAVDDPRRYRCWAGCSKEEIRAAVGCPIKLFPGRETWQMNRARA